jgi:hypothetical protein
MAFFPTFQKSEIEAKCDVSKGILPSLSMSSTAWQRSEHEHLMNHARGGQWEGALAENNICARVPGNKLSVF